MDIKKIKPYVVALECSPVHVANVIADLQKVAIESERLANEVMNLNPSSGEIGEGYARSLINMAESVKNAIGN